VCLVAKRDERIRQSALGSAPPASAEEFHASLKRRRQAAQGLEQDLLTKVPLLYGSPDGCGDPDVVLARIHRDEMLRRNGGGVFSRSRKRSDVALPFELTPYAAVILLFLYLLFVR
jgi:hypothetical protein